MTTEEWLEKEGYPITMPMTRSNLADIIDRYVMQVARKNFIKPDVIKSVCLKCNGNGMINEPNKPEMHDCEFCDGTGQTVL